MRLTSARIANLCTLQEIQIVRSRGMMRLGTEVSWTTTTPTSCSEEEPTSKILTKRKKKSYRKVSSKLPNYIKIPPSKISKMMKQLLRSQSCHSIEMQVKLLKLLTGPTVRFRHSLPWRAIIFKFWTSTLKMCILDGTKTSIPVATISRRKLSQKLKVIIPASQFFSPNMKIHPKQCLK